jgi:hypothetical protein
MVLSMNPKPSLANSQRGLDRHRPDAKRRRGKREKWRRAECLRQVFSRRCFVRTPLHGICPTHSRDASAPRLSLQQHKQRPRAPLKQDRGCGFRSCVQAALLFNTTFGDSLLLPDHSASRIVSGSRLERNRRYLGLSLRKTRGLLVHGGCDRLPPCLPHRMRIYAPYARR